MPPHAIVAEWDTELVGGDPLGWAGYRAPSPESVVTGRTESYAFIEGRFDVLGGSMGAAHGERVVRAYRRAVDERLPIVVLTASGGARMQEGVLSLMQLPRTTVAVQELRLAKLPYIVVLTHPTTGGVTASYAMLGDIQISEPGALIGFAGQRVIEQTIREKLPAGFQRAEYLEEHGMVDMVVHRHQMRETVSRIARMLMKAPELPSLNGAALVPAEAAQ